jgi:hypothetical protein
MLCAVEPLSQALGHEIDVASEEDQNASCNLILNILKRRCVFPYAVVRRPTFRQEALHRLYAEAHPIDMSETRERLVRLFL